MRKHFNFDDKNIVEQGFTLIELLVVIAILGILAAVVVFAVGGITKRGKESACQIDARTIKTAIESYNAQQGNYPASLAVLAPGFLDKDPTAAPASPSVAAGGVYHPATGAYDTYACPTG